MSRLAQMLSLINQLEKDGVIARYAIGGAVGATFYLEPIATLDVDIFVIFRGETPGSLLSLKPIFDYLTARGGVVEGEYIVIAGWPVQFLPPTSRLVEEALDDAVEVHVNDIPVRVFTAEHLAAVAIQTGRPKDKARLLQFIESGVLDIERFKTILARHDLSERWREFQRTFLSGAQ